MSTAEKDTVYIDIDDEITSIIEKMRASKHKIVALVLPKRATALQSIVNMKLLKRSADEVGKRVVLITSEAGLLPLAGAVGLYVAKTLQTKPHIPAPPDVSETNESIVDANVPEGPESELDASKSIGELAGFGAVAEEKEETIELDEPDSPPEAGKDKGKGKSGKKIKIPDFNSFRMRMFLAVGVFILLVVGWFVLAGILPKAKITIQTDTTSLNANLTFTANTAIKELDEAGSLVPATLKEVSKTEAEKAPSTGQKDVGTKAIGTVTLKNCTKTDGSLSIPAGTGVSTGSLTFITTEAVLLPASTFSGGGSCTTATKDVNVVAQNAGTQYNITGGRTFTVSGFSGVTGTDSSDMAGGTSKIVKVVSDQDIEGAKQRALDRSTVAAKTDLKDALQKELLFALEETIIAGAPAVTPSPKAGEEASEVTVTVVTAFSMLGVKEDDLKKLIENEAKKQIDTAKQAISDSGLSSAVIKVTEKKSQTEMKLSVETLVTAGAHIDIEALKKEIAGKKRGEVENIIKDRPGVKDVQVEYSPFWVYSTPKKTGRIQIILENSPANDNTSQ